MALILVGAATLAQAEKRAVFKLPSTQLEPITFAQIDGWAEDDHDAAFGAFLNSCRAILQGTKSSRPGRPMYAALFDVCQKAVELKPQKPGEAKSFFEQYFRPVHISPLGDPDGFLTGYYEPIVEGTRKETEGYDYPLYRRPTGLTAGGRMAVTDSSGQRRGKKKKRHRRRFVKFHDRAAIDDGALAGRNLEICWLKDPIDAFFAHIQGSVRVRLEDGEILRLNYQAANGHPYVAVGKFLIERGIIPKEEMSMDRIREWMERNPEEGKALRRKNKSYVFFRETNLQSNDEPIGAQGISLTPGRSIAVDHNLHVYGTPFFISATLPINSLKPDTPFRRLMIAQDTGGAIIGPARADIYFGAGDEAGSISGRLRHPGRFVMLLPKTLDPNKTDEPVPLPRPRPAIEVATAPSEPEPAPQATASVESEAQAPAAPQAAVPQPQPKPQPEAAAPMPPQPSGLAEDGLPRKDETRLLQEDEAKSESKAKPQREANADVKRIEPKKKSEAKKPEPKKSAGAHEDSKKAASKKPARKVSDSEALAAAALSSLHDMGITETAPVEAKPAHKGRRKHSQ